MKVILNKDLNPLGEEGDIREVAKGYARNYLFPRGIALPYTEKTIKLFEARRDEIEARKEAKRQDASGLREKLEALELVISMPAGANGKLYGAVTSQTVVEELAKHGFPTERKRVELPGNTFKSVGKYKVTVKLYESAAAEVNLTIEAQIVKTETKEQPVRKDRRRRQSFEVGLGKTAAAEDIAAETGAGETAAAGSAEVESVSTEIPAADTSKADDADVTVSPAEANTEQN